MRKPSELLKRPCDNQRILLLLFRSQNDYGVWHGLSLVLKVSIDLSPKRKLF